MQSKVRKVDLASLKRDFQFYPRQAVNSETVNRFVDAMQAGAKFPPIRVCAKTGRIIDGFHRYGAYFELQIAEVEVVGEDIEDAKDFFIRAVEANKAHGFGYCHSDYKRIAEIATKLGLEREQISLISSIPIQKLSELTRNVPKPDVTLGMPLKGNQRHVQESSQPPAVDPLRVRSDAISSQGFIFYCNQVLRFLNGDLCDPKDPQIRAKLKELQEAVELQIKRGEEPPKPIKIPDNRGGHPAIQAFKAASGFYPKRMLFDKVIETLGEAPDVTRLNHVFVAWTGRGYNPHNLNWLQWYIEGVPQNGNGSSKRGYETASSRNVRNITESLAYLQTTGGEANS